MRDPITCQARMHPHHGLKMCEATSHAEGALTATPRERLSMLPAGCKMRREARWLGALAPATCPNRRPCLKREPGDDRVCIGLGTGLILVRLIGLCALLLDCPPLLDPFEMGCVIGRECMAAATVGNKKEIV